MRSSALCASIIWTRSWESCTRTGTGDPRSRSICKRSSGLIFCDAFALRLINKPMLKHEDFQADNHLKDYAFKIYLEKFDDYMQEEFIHPRFDYTVSRRKAVRLQAILLRKAITGELKEYYPLEFRK